MDQPKGIDRDAMRFQVLGTILDWLAGWLAGWLSGTNSLDLVCKCFLGRLELKTTIFFPHNQYNKKETFTRDRTHFTDL